MRIGESSAKKRLCVSVLRDARLLLRPSTDFFFAKKKWVVVQEGGFPVLMHGLRYRSGTRETPARPEGRAPSFTPVNGFFLREEKMGCGAGGGI
jgi:hypothetical protein